MLSAIRNFFITLLASLILLGLTGYMITDFSLSMLDPDRDIPTDTEDTSGDDLPPDETDQSGPDIPILTGDESFTMLLIGHDHQPDVFQDYTLSGVMGEDGFPATPRKVRADMLIILRVDQKTNTVMMTNLPANARVSDMGLTKSLGDLYGEHGAAYLAQRVTSLIGIPVDYYVSVGIPGLIALIDQTGGITYRVPQDMNYFDETENYTISLKAGMQKLDGKKVLQLLRFNGYGDDGSARMSTAIGVLRALIEKVVADRDYYTSAQSIYGIMSAYVETNFTWEDAARKLDLIFLYPEMTVNTNRYPGQMIKEETVITPPEGLLPTDPTVPGTPTTPGTPTVPGTPSNPTAPETPSEGETVITYWYKLDIVNGRALFSAYKYKG